MVRIMKLVSSVCALTYFKYATKSFIAQTNGWENVCLRKDMVMFSSFLSL